MKKMLFAAALAALCTVAQAGTIVSATSATINAGGPGFGAIADTYNQNGLSVNYISGVTDFASYLAGPVIHTNVYLGYEWFTNVGVTAASVTYDLGLTRTLSGMVLWNEETAGINALNLLYSTDGITFNMLASGLAPLNNPSSSYRGEVFAFGAVDARYIRLDMSGCPQAGSNATYCAIGEVAFDATVRAVPEPASIALFGLGLAGLAALRRRRA